MEKTITSIHCDDCGKIILEKDRFRILGFDFCVGCVSERINISKTIARIGKEKCTWCENGKIKDYGSYGYSYEYIECKKCHGLGKVYKAPK